MIRDITIGQYYPAESRIHRLDPRVKIVCTLLFLVSLFIQNSLPGYVIATLFLGTVIRLSKVPLKYIVKGPVPYSERGDAGAFLDLYDHGGRTEDLCVYGSPSDVSCGRIVHHDIYHIAERADRRYGETAPSAEQAQCSGP